MTTSSELAVLDILRLPNPFLCVFDITGAILLERFAAMMFPSNLKES